MSDTPISPGAGAIALAGIALSLISGTVTARVPTIGSLALGSAAPSVVAQLQNQDIPGTVNLLYADSKTGIIKRWPGGAGLFSVVGVWGGATVTLQFSGPDGVTMIPVGTATTLTANGAGAFNLPPCQIQAAISSATTTSLTAAAQSIPTQLG